MELPRRVTWYLTGLGLKLHCAQGDGGRNALHLLLTRFALHVAAVALRAAVLVVGTAHRLQGTGRRIVRAGRGMRQVFSLKYQPTQVINN